MKLIPVILCGGSGSRLWPISREHHPKPFLRLDDNQSLLQKAFIRAASLPGVEEILTITNRELFFKTQDDYVEVNSQNLATSFILEPFGRNTAAAITAAALKIASAYTPDTQLLILAADHIITNQAAFEQAVESARELAATGRLVALGTQPTAPETGYGYIEAKDNQVLRFIEKPSKETAEHYISSGHFYWNTGIFCFSANTFIEEAKKHCPDVLNTVNTCLTHSRHSNGKHFIQIELDKKHFMAVPDISIDYAVMERSSNVAVVPCDIGWRDIGSWPAIESLENKDAHGNTTSGEVILHSVKNSYIRSNTKGRVIGVVGMEDVFIVDTPDALLVAKRSYAQDVKNIYIDLKNRGHETHKFHRTVTRPWGFYTVLEKGDGFNIKQILVKPKCSLSLQMHHHRSEHWIVVHGMAQVTRSDEEFLVATNESTYISAGQKHRLTNPGVIDLILIEIQSGEYLGEDDIVRFEDNYGHC